MPITRHNPFVALFNLLIFFQLFFQLSVGRDTINPLETLGDNEILESGIFVLGFFSPEGKTGSRYLGIWYNFSHETIVWVANRQRPVMGRTGVLQLTADGKLTLTDQNRNSSFWETNTLFTAAASGNSRTKAQLLETGNFIVEVAGVSQWQSFDYPTDTQLPGMKLGLNLTSGFNRILMAWKSTDDPSPSNVVFKMDPNGSHEMFTDINQQHTFRVGPWNGVRFNGNPRMAAYSNKFNYTYVQSNAEVYYSFETVASGLVTRVKIEPDGYFRRFVWVEGSHAWNEYWRAPATDCDRYQKCGPNGVCSDTPDVCDCFVGFEPSKASAWIQRDFEVGCARKTKLSCGTREEEDFCLLTGLKLPDTSNSMVNLTMGLSDCRAECLRNCSCSAYAAATISGSVSGCFMWFDDLIDTRTFTSGGQELYLRLPLSELDHTLCNNHMRRKKEVKITLTVVIGILLMVLLCGLCIWRRKVRNMRKLRGTRMISSKDIASKWKDEIPLFDFPAVSSSTNNFSAQNRIGEGGFGTVFKGTLADGQVVAIKRLSMNSRQGLDEFMNEVMLIAKLQHKNLVRLLGCCIEGEERMLVYEFMLNKSLDCFIFDKNKRSTLDWRKRVDIICGIGRGLLYLHQDSRLKVIHRDLKAGNILLDEEMDPKISDFGTARIFGNDQIEQTTRRVIGTFGYMSPEYVMDGIFSVKSDVFSFGVLLLEIISGRKNRILHQEEHSSNLLEMAWRSWENGNSLELLDDTIPCSCSTSEFIRFVQIGLLCVQECATDRPTMASVAFMLSSDSSLLPEPERPGFIRGRRSSLKGERHSSTRHASLSFTINNVTCTDIQGR